MTVHSHLGVYAGLQCTQASARLTPASRALTALPLFFATATGGYWVSLFTDGGGLSACHPGMRGIFLLIESVRQLRGDAGPAQVPDCKVAVACGSGAWLSFIGTVVMSTELGE
jgi:acetyl-CoA acetyltransferase